MGEVTTAVANPLAETGAQIAAAGPRVVKDVRIGRGNELVVRAERDALPALMLLLRDDPRFAFEQCMDICGVDHPDRPNRFEVVYNLLSLSRNARLRVVVDTDEATPVPSVCDIWPSATWYEREAWDMFGIAFAGQPDLRRLLTDYGF